MTYDSFAKINLALDILGKDPSGYHQIRTVYQTIPVADTFYIDQTQGNGSFKVKFRGPEAGQINPKDNTVLSAIQQLQAQWTFKHSYEIIIEKRIPIASGLGGGSSNAATVIKALNALEMMSLTYDQERAIAAKIGMDVPFFIEEGTAIGTHFGEVIENLPEFGKLSGWAGKNKALIIPKERNITSEMYAKVDLSKTAKNVKKTDDLIAAIREGNSEKTISFMHNDFENFVDPYFAEVKTILEKQKADHVLLCGSGSGILATFSSPFDLEVLSQALPDQRILSLIQWVAPEQS